jgi:glioma pathogenesis-related protein 2
MANRIFILLLGVLALEAVARAPFPDLTTTAFQDQCLTKTNYFRALHQNTPSLTTDPNVVNYAKSRCQQVSQYPGLSEGHSGLASGYGENLYWSASSAPFTPNCDSAVSSWYSESSSYSYANPGFSSATGHFTQLIWAATTKEGCAACGGQDPGSPWHQVYVVCNYVPPGNYLG